MSETTNVTEEIHEDEWYVLFDGAADDGSDDGDVSSANAFAAPASAYSDVKQAFDEGIQKGYVDRNKGSFITRLNGVTESQVNTLVDLEALNTLVRNDFKGFKTTEVEAYKSSLNDFVAGALGDLSDGTPEGAVKTDTGWVYVEENSNPYA